MIKNHRIGLGKQRAGLPLLSVHHYRKKFLKVSWRRHQPPMIVFPKIRQNQQAQSCIDSLTKKNMVQRAVHSTPPCKDHSFKFKPLRNGARLFKKSEAVGMDKAFFRCIDHIQSQSVFSFGRLGKKTNIPSGSLGQNQDSGSGFVNVNAQGHPVVGKETLVAKGRHFQFQHLQAGFLGHKTQFKIGGPTSGFQKFLVNNVITEFQIGSERLGCG